MEEEKNIQLYCNIDETGRITRILSGERIIPTAAVTFKHFFMITKKTAMNLDKFHVKDGDLQQIEGTTLIEVDSEHPTPEQELENVKKELEEMKKLFLSFSTSNQTQIPTDPEEPTAPVEEEPANSEEPTTPVEEVPADSEEPTTPVEEVPTDSEEASSVISSDENTY